MQKIVFLNLHRQYASIHKAIKANIDCVLKKQDFILGTMLKKFETKFAKYLDIQYVVGVNSGTDALLFSLKALGISKGDEVITPVNSFMATTLAIVEVGAIPVFVDCDPQTYQIDMNEVKKKITKKTKAILPVHLYGAASPIEELISITKRYKLFLIEDAAQAHGAMYDGKKLGTFGDISIYSFYPGKNLGAYGDAGAVVTNKKDLYEKLLKLRNYGMTKKYYHEEIGYNSRLDEIQAAVLLTKLPYLNKWNIKRNKIANCYKNGLKYTHYQHILENTISCYHLFVIESEYRDELVDFLKKKGISTLIHYPLPLHLQKCFSFLGYKKGDFPIAERLASQIVSLPLYPEMTDTEVNYIIRQVNSFESKKMLIDF